ncbi:hypothetical protein AF72_05895 [Xylella taiwanensis]|uniref:Uncharacterized protein n=1 Tax=Xylella taiwanensis TaxID=1444770 RepID=Z9JK40_9GAMM|nr:hypothetical protein AF72_05895 [Xylella taiwanensis]
MKIEYGAVLDMQHHHHADHPQSSNDDCNHSPHCHIPSIDSAAGAVYWPPHSGSEHGILPIHWTTWCAHIAQPPPSSRANE